MPVLATCREARQAPRVPRHGSWRDSGISLGYAGVGKQFGHAISAIVPALPLRRLLNRCAHRDRGFAREFLPDDYDEVRHIFSRRGAYRRYKDLLVRRGALDLWYDFSNKAEETALREWCAENGIELSET